MNDLQDGTYLKSADGKLVRVEVSSGYWVATHETTLSAIKTGDLVGVWRDAKTGAVWVDAVRLVLDASQARVLGKKHNQIAIWDNANACEVRL
jgi:hypothetical protein